MALAFSMPELAEATILAVFSLATCIFFFFFVSYDYPEEKVFLFKEMNK